jgi:hypothetical protein
MLIVFGSVKLTSTRLSMRSILFIGTFFALCFAIASCVPANGVYVSLRSDIMKEIGEGKHDVYYQNIVLIITRSY